MLISPRPNAGAATDDITLPTPDRSCPHPTGRSSLQALWGNDMDPPKPASTPTQPIRQPPQPHSSDMSSTPPGGSGHPHISSDERGSAMPAGFSQPDFSAASPEMAATPFSSSALCSPAAGGSEPVGTHSAAAGPTHFSLQVGSGQVGPPLAAPRAQVEANSEVDSDTWSSDSELDSELGEPCELRADFLQTFEPVGAFLTKLGASFCQPTASAGKSAPLQGKKPPLGRSDEQTRHPPLPSAAATGFEYDDAHNLENIIGAVDEACMGPPAAHSSCREMGDGVHPLGSCRTPATDSAEVLDSLLAKIPTRGVTSLGDLAALGMAIHSAAASASPEAAGDHSQGGADDTLGPLRGGLPTRGKPSMLEHLWAQAQAPQPGSPQPTFLSMCDSSCSLPPQQPSTSAATFTLGAAQDGWICDGRQTAVQCDRTQAPQANVQSIGASQAADGATARVPDDQHRANGILPTPILAGLSPAGLAAVGSAKWVPTGGQGSVGDETDGDAEDMAGAETGDAEEGYGDLTAEDDEEANRKLGAAAGRIALAMMKGEKPSCKVCLLFHVYVRSEGR